MKKFTRQKKHQVSCCLLFCTLYINTIWSGYLTLTQPRFLLYPSRSQAPVEECTAGAKEEQKERLLQGAGGWQERHRGRD